MDINYTSPLSIQEQKLLRTLEQSKSLTKNQHRELYRLKLKLNNNQDMSRLTPPELLFKLCDINHSKKKTENHISRCKNSKTKHAHQAHLFEINKQINTIKKQMNKVVHNTKNSV